jgi:signal transduction histidine kinase/ligand-binding sensor domain-containing protein/DNA-binding response OmpR family regulator
MKRYATKANRFSVYLYLGLFLNCFLAIPTGVCQNIPVKFYHLTVDNGLSHTDTKAIKQDKLGFIWIATLFGLDKYDGYSIKPFYNDLHPQENASRNRVRDLYPDADGKIWLATESGIQCFDSRFNRYIDISPELADQAHWGFTNITELPNGNMLALSDHGISELRVNKNKLFNEPLIYPSKTIFTSIVIDRDQHVWLTSNNALWILDHNEIREKFVFDERTRSGNISKAYFDNLHHLFLVGREKIYFTDEPLDQVLINSDKLIELNTLKTLEPPKTVIRDIVQDKHRNYWISTDKGLLFYDAHLRFSQMIDSKSNPNGLNTNHIEKLFIDKSQCLWICSYGGGVNYIDLNAKLFYTLQHIPDQENSLSGNHIRALIDEGGQNLWIGTNENGLNCYNYKNKKFIHFNTTSIPALKSNVITCLAFDAQNNLWVGTDNGVEILSKDRRHLVYPTGYNSFPNYQIESLAADRYGQMWFSSSEKQMGVITQNKGVFSVHYMGDALFIYPDPDRPEVYASSNHGLIHFYLNNDGSIAKTYTYQTNNSNSSLSSNYIYPIARYSDSSLCVGTIGGGLNFIVIKPDGNYKATVFGEKYHIFNDVESIQLDDHKHIWMGGRELEEFDPQTHGVVHYNKNDGLQGNSFKIGASCKGKDGKLYFGGINGLNYFFPDSIKINSLPATPVLTDFVIHNNSLADEHTVSGQNPIKASICYSNHIQLNYLQNNFSIYFSALHFANPLKCLYRYKLAGFDKDWIYTDGSNPVASYNNLDYNNYRFVVEASNNDGIWSKDKAVVSIVITPPWWKSTVAKLFYSFLLVSALAGIYIYQARWFRLKREIAIREVEEGKREELHKQREDLYKQQLEFFTNVSHEFRTPLTLISGPLENLLKENLNSAYRQTLQIMSRNAKRLTNLINELMNFTKVSDGIIKLQIEPVNLNEFIVQLSDEFHDFAINKSIRFSVVKPVKMEAVYIDLNIVEKILYNLLNNAFKYTTEAGSIILEVFFDWPAFKPAYSTEFKLLNQFRAKNYMYFRVADTGIGISKESIGQLFDRYYRVSTDHLGSGVGLALVKSLTFLHKGDIFIYSERHKGTEIVIGLPWGESNYEALEKAPQIMMQPNAKIEKLDNSVLYSNNMVIPGTNARKKTAVTTQHILLVEDNEDLRAFLTGILEEHYHIYEATNGRRGLEIAIDSVPDLIISDIMMPEMNGIALCKEIKQNFETSHIPFMLLSAKDALETKLEGLGFGADYYFSKPLSTQQLLLTIKNLFEQKEKLKSRYIKDYYAEASDLVHSTIDKNFLGKLITVIENNIEKYDLDVDYLSHEMNVSRTKLYQKIQSVTGQPAGEFIRTVRLKKAAYIMTHEDISLSALIDRIGMQSSSNFAKIFKKEFGMLPSEFLQKIKSGRS